MLFMFGYFLVCFILVSSLGLYSLLSFVNLLFITHILNHALTRL